MFKNVYVPYKGYWCSPFCKWQGSFQTQHAVQLAAGTAKKFFEVRGITPDIFDSLVFGATIPQKMWFYDAPWFATLIGNPYLAGPRVAQACATSTIAIKTAATAVEAGSDTNALVATCDRASNCPNILWPNPSGLGGKPDFESWMLDGFMFEPTGDTGPLGTAINVTKQHGITREESDALVVDRYNKYLMSTANDREFQKRYMLPVEVQLSRKKTIMVEEDEGITPCTAEGLAKLRTMPDSIINAGSQTHAADGNAGMVVTTKEKANELTADKAVTIQILSYGVARAEKAHMPNAPVPASQKALEKAGISVSDLSAVKTHNPFSVNDIIMRKEMGIDDKIFNNYGSSLIFGHPQGPTVMRLAIEAIEELVIKGGGYGLVAGCAAGDTGAALVIKVN
ncbi:MAG: thiolase family protein [Acidobacteriota bacterium]|jgi:acetyl-CoA acetyltransferase family protein